MAVDSSLAGPPAPEPTASVDLTTAERLHQALVVHTDGRAEFSFLARPAGEAITAIHRGVAWVAYPARDAPATNLEATAFARSMGWTGPDSLGGTVVFVGDGAVEDVPGVLVAEAMRRWSDLPVS